jgi:2-polyprenyl-3-methyl-5-hydroxy-6-metoxy-1,4-benzoquinol methylase
VVLGFLTKENGNYGLTQDSAIFLDRRSPAYVGGATEFLLSPTLYQSFENFTEAVRKGGTTLPAEGTVSYENPVWVRFARGMAPLMAMPSEHLAVLALCGSQDPVKVLDIAAGHGMFGIAVAKQNPNAQIVAQDWANVLQVAQENAEKAGVSDRFSQLPGSAFEVDLGSDYDIVLLTNFLHHFDPPTCESLLKRIHKSLKPGGKVLTLEFIPEENRVAPPASAMFSVIMLASTPSGDAYTFSEFDRMFKNSGFSRNELTEIPPMMQVVISQK